MHGAIKLAASSREALRQSLEGLETSDLLALGARFTRDTERLVLYLEVLRGRPGPKAQLAACLICFDLARQGHSTAQQDFLGLIPTFRALAEDPVLVEDLLGGDTHLRKLWEDSQKAIASDDPVIFFEPKGKYWTKGEVDRAATADLTTAATVLKGTDATLVAYGPMVATALDAAIAASDEGISLEVIDLRSISPIDRHTVASSVRRTGRLIVTHEAAGTASVASEVITGVIEDCFEHLEAAPERVTGYDTPYPPAALEEVFLPDLDRILDAVDRTLGRRNSRSHAPTEVEVSA